MPDPDWAAGRRRSWSATRIAAAVLLHLLVLVALRLAVDRVHLPTRAGERVTTLVDVTLHTAPPPAIADESPPRVRMRMREHERVLVRPAPAVPRVRPVEAPAVRVQAAEPEPLAIIAPPAALAPASGRAFLDNDATRQAIRDAARGTLRNRVGEQLREDPGSELVAADGTHVGDTRHVTPTPAQRLERDVAAAHKGDCMKGEYAGAGMGLLSAPFLLANEVLGKCAHKL